MMHTLSLYNEIKVMARSAINSKKPLIYLASPYTHEKRSEMAKRFVEISRIAAKLTIMGHYIISPISMNHPWKEYGDDNIGYSWEFWKEFDTRLLEVCDELWVAKMPGWTISVGVQAEIVIAGKLGLPIRYLNPDTLIISNKELN